jgi:hypothetical protein
MIVNLDIVKKYMNIVDNADDNFITLIINAVNDVIDNSINQNIMAKDVTLNFDGNDSCLYLIPQFPVNSITTLKYRDYPNTTWQTLVADSDYYSTTKNGLTELYYSIGFYPETEFELAMNTGYVTAPADVQLIAIQMVKNYYDESTKGKDRLGVSSVSEAKQMSTINTTYINLTPKWEAMLSPYRRPVL